MQPPLSLMYPAPSCKKIIYFEASYKRCNNITTKKKTIEYSMEDVT